MGKLLLFATILSTAWVTLRRPFVGAMAYYCLAIWGPQYIWWWNFEGMRVSFIVAIISFLSLGIALTRTGLNFSLLKSKINACVVLLWISFLISYGFAPYVTQLGEVPGAILDRFNKIVLFYFVAVLLVDDIDKAKVFSWVIILAMIHLTYWANLQYLAGHWEAFNMGRLMGPHDLMESGSYRDENAFAMFFVTAVPFVFYAGAYLIRGLYRYALWAVIPLGWHAIFLTGSRGGLVGLGATLVAGAFFSKKRVLFICVIIPLFLVAFYYQAGDLLRERSSTIVDYQEESSAETRLQAWAAASGMMRAYPFTGVGIGCFVPAMRDFSDNTPRDTHSTPLKFGAEVGVAGLFAYCLINILMLWQGLSNNRLIRRYEFLFKEEDRSVLRYLNDSYMVSFFGLSVCSLFLSLNYYEVYFFLLIIAGLLRYHILSTVRTGARD